VAVVEEEKAVWLNCVGPIIDGEGEFDLVRDLNKRGVSSPMGGTWGTGNLRKMLSRERYVRFDPTGHPADCPCLKNPENGGTLIHHRPPGGVACVHHPRSPCPVAGSL